jgi:hypothetical protein
VPTSGHQKEYSAGVQSCHAVVTQALAGKRLSLCGTDVELLKFLIENDPVTMSLTELAAVSTIKFGTLRHSLGRLQSQGYFQTGQIMDGKLRRTVFGLNPQKCMEFMQALRINPFEKTGHVFSSGHLPNNEHMSMRSQLAPDAHMSRQEHATNNEHQKSSLDRKIKENLSILEELGEEARSLYQIDDEDMEILLPDLYRAGFTSTNVRSLIERRHKNRLDLSDPTAKMIRMGLRYADAALRIGGGSFKGTINTVVENVPSYVFTVLFKEASFTKPQDWEPEEVLAQRLEMDRLRQEAERLRLEDELKAELENKEKKEREELDYLAWRGRLTAGEIAAFKERCPNKKSEESLERFLRIEWRKTLG